MKIKKNQKGVTLVEVIVAMTMLASMGAMICSAFIYSNHSRVNTMKRVEEENQQATDIEKFNYKMGAVDYDTANLAQMSEDPYKMTFDFGVSGVSAIVHESYGFTSTSTDLSESGFALTFFTPSLNSLELEAGDYWITIDSNSVEAADDFVFTTDDSTVSFFDAGKNIVGELQADGTYKYELSVSGSSSTSFGIHAESAASIDYEVNAVDSGSISFGSLVATKTSDDGGVFATIYFNGSDISYTPDDGGEAE